MVGDSATAEQPRLTTCRALFYIDIRSMPKKLTAFRIDEELLRGLSEVWERDGITAPEQVRRAVRDWLQKKGIDVKTAPRRAGTRRRA